MSIATACLAIAALSTTASAQCSPVVGTRLAVGTIGLEEAEAGPTQDPDEFSAVSAGAFRA